MYKRNMYVRHNTSANHIILMRELKISYTSEILTLNISLHTLVLVYDHSHLGL